ncbi:MAG: segregation/condensation protein A, partial [Clostridiales bacterium]|nr:segregation/condensation protein A [Clostridiales bacterium]
MNQPAHQLRLEVFEGPFELLIHLIDKNQLDIYDIPI